MRVQDVPLGPRSLAVVPAPMHFNMLAVHWTGTGAVLYRTHRLHGGWSGWTAADADVAPDGGTGPWHDGGLQWTGAADGFRFRRSGVVQRLRVYELWSRVTTRASRSLSAAAAPAIVSRSGWHANEEIVRAAPRFAPAVRLAVVHHTAGANSYYTRPGGGDRAGHRGLPRAGKRLERHRLQLPCRPVRDGVRGPRRRDHQERDRRALGGLQLGHRRRRADRQLHERETAAGDDRRAGQAARVAPRRRARRSAVEGGLSLGWQREVQGRNRGDMLRAISGHRDTGPTECPGNDVYALLPAIARRVSLTGLPKLYSPTVAGALGGPVRFEARVSSALRWTVTITDQLGRTVASGQGRGPLVDWTWSAPAAAQGRFTWTIAAPGARPATGTIGAGRPAPAPPLSLTTSRRCPSSSPRQPTGPVAARPSRSRSALRQS